MAIKEQIKSWLMDNLGNDFEAIGLRYDNRAINVGDELECSIQNWDREDDRDFSEYDEDAERANGTCAYHIIIDFGYMDCEEEIDEGLKQFEHLFVDKDKSVYNHASIITGNQATGEVEDEGEILISNAKVEKVLF